MSVFKQSPAGHMYLSGEYLFPESGEIDLTRKQGDVFHIPIIGEAGGPEPFTFPPGAQIFPNNDELWEIVQVVAKEDSTRTGYDRDFDDNPLTHFCPFCGNEMQHLALVNGEDFLHTANCIVTKARALVEQRSVQPKITVKVMLDNKQITGEK
jgi:hypothetical protein